MENNKINGKKNIKNYIKKVLPNLKLLNVELNQLIDDIIVNNSKEPYEKEILLKIVSFLDSRPLFLRNIVGVEDGIYRTMEGNADEMIVVGKLIKMGFNCSRVDVTNSKYDAVIDKEGKLLRVQIKATAGNSLDLTCGGRSGKQINRNAPSRQRKITKKDCDVLVGMCKESAICYVIPSTDLLNFKNSASFSSLAIYKENWNNIK